MKLYRHTLTFLTNYADCGIELVESLQSDEVNYTSLESSSQAVEVIDV